MIRKDDLLKTLKDIQTLMFSHRSFVVERALETTVVNYSCVNYPKITLARSPSKVDTFSSNVRASNANRFLMNSGGSGGDEKG